MKNVGVRSAIGETLSLHFILFGPQYSFEYSSKDGFFPALYGTGHFQFKNLIEERKIYEKQSNALPTSKNLTFLITEKKVATMQTVVSVKPKAKYSFL